MGILQLHRYMGVLIALLVSMPFSVVSFAFDFSAMDESSGDTRVAVRAGMWSRHSGKHNKDGQNETHQQVGFKYGEYTAWSYINSNEKRGYYVGKDDLWKWDWLSNKLPVDIKYGFSIGVLTGYKFTKDRHWSPIVLPIAAIDFTENFSVDLQFIPAVATALNLRWNF